MKKIFALLIVSIMLLSLAGCIQTTSPPSVIFPVNTIKPPTTAVGTPMSFNVVKGDAPRITALNVSDAQLSSLVTGNSKVLWIIIIVFIQIFGPVAYLLFGRKEDRIAEDS